jgi:hypothetical protein
LEVLLYTAQWCEAQAQKTVPFSEWERGRIEGGGVRKGITDEIEQSDDGSDEVELDDSSP